MSSSPCPHRCVLRITALMYLLGRIKCKVLALPSLETKTAFLSTARSSVTTTTTNTCSWKGPFLFSPSPQRHHEQKNLVYKKVQPTSLCRRSSSLSFLSTALQQQQQQDDEYYNDANSDEYEEIHQCLMDEIQQSTNSYELGYVIRSYTLIFTSPIVPQLIVDKIQELKEDMCPRDVSALMNAVSKQHVTQRTRNRRQSIMVALSDVAMSLMERQLQHQVNDELEKTPYGHIFQERDLYVVFSTLTKCQLPNQKQLFNMISDEMVTIMDSYSAKQLCNIVQACGKVNVPNLKDQYRCNELLDAVARQSLERMNEFSGQGLTLLTQAFAKTNYYQNNKSDKEDKYRLFDEVAERVLVSLDSLNSRDVHNLVYAFVKVRRPHKELMDGIANYVVQSSSSLFDANHNLISPRKITKKGFNGDVVRKLMTNYAMIHHNHHDLIKLTKDVTVPVVRSLKPNELCGVVNSFSKLNHYDKEFLDLVSEASVPRLNEFTSKCLATMMNSMAKLNYRNDKLFQAISQQSMKTLTSFTPSELSGLINAHAKLNQPNPILFDAAALQTVKTIQKFDAHQLSMMVNAYARTRHKHPLLFQTVAKAAIPLANNFTPQGLSNMVNAYARLGERTPSSYQLLESIATASISKINQFNSQELSNTVNAYAKLNHKHAKLFNAVADIAIPQITKFNARDCSNTVNAFSKVNHKRHDLFQKIAKRSIPIVHNFNGQELSILVNAYANIRHKAPHLFLAVAEAALDRMDELNCQGLSTTIHAFGKTNVQHLKLFQAVAERSLDRMEEFTPQGLSNIVRAFAECEYALDYPMLYDRAAEIVVRNIDTYEPQSLVTTINAYAKAKIYKKQLFDVIAQASLTKLKEYHIVEIPKLLTAYDQIGSPKSELFQRIADEVVLPNVKEFTPEALVSIVRAYASSNFVHEELFFAIKTRCIEVMNRLDGKGLTNLVWAYAKIATTDDDKYSDLFDAVEKVISEKKVEFGKEDRGVLLDSFAMVNRSWPDELVFTLDSSDVKRKKDGATATTTGRTNENVVSTKKDLDFTVSDFTAGNLLS